jgi:hypothetical protein
MGFAAITIWMDGARQCVLRRTDGQFELVLQVDGHVRRLETFLNEVAARDKAADWRRFVERGDPATRVR